MKIEKYLEKVFNKRYLQPGETTEGMIKRVSTYVASAENAYKCDHPEQLLLPGKKSLGSFQDDLIDEWMCGMREDKWLPSSPFLMNAGTKVSMLSACFVCGLEDEMQGIFETLKNAAMIQKMGGGTGFNFSVLRSEGAAINSTGGESSGPLSFMEIYNTMGNTVKQGGRRRSANMGILRVDHPDILKFIRYKSDMTKLNNFNVSVAVTDSFMQAVKNKAKYNLIDPATKEIVGELDAAEVFKEIAYRAWLSGEPGIVFIDAINKYNPTPLLGDIEATNPCVTGDTWVMTQYGPRQMKNLVNERCITLVDSKPYVSTGSFVTGDKEVFTIKTKRGYELKATANHPLKVFNGEAYEWIEVGNLSEGMLLKLSPQNGSWHNIDSSIPEQFNNEEAGWILGEIIGDGGISEDYAPYMRFWNASKEELRHYAVKAVKSIVPPRTDFTGSYNDANDTYTVKTIELRKLTDIFCNNNTKELLDIIEMTSSSFQVGFIRGLFDADGSVQGSTAHGISVRLSNNDLPLLKRVQRMLLRFGIASTVYENRRLEHEKLMPDGKGGEKLYTCAVQHELVISKSNIKVYAERISFIEPAKKNMLSQLISSYTREMYKEKFVDEIVSITSSGVETVYDITVDMVHEFDANGICAHNCGEIPLLPYEACNLASLNLGHFVKEDGTIDYPELARQTRLVMRFLDNAVDVNQYPLPLVKEAVQKTRKLG